MISFSSKRFSPYAPLVLRLALAGVFIWFGISQIVNPNEWISIVPSWTIDFLHTSALDTVQINGWFEITFGSFLALGIFVQPVAALLFIHLLVIASHFGLSPVGVRDFGLSFATLAVALLGEDKYCFFSKERQSSLTETP